MTLNPNAPTNSSPKAKRIYLLLTLAAGIILLLPTTNFQDWLSTGDHGRDLDAFEQTLNGKAVYQDYWWVYGPLMPYYYAFFYKVLGIKIQSILIGKFIIKLTAGALCYLAVSTFFAPLAGFMAALWFWGFQQDFFFTYNHIGGIAVEMGIIWCLLSYIKNQRQNILWQGLVLCFILAMIKVNYGLSSLATLLAATFIVDRSYKIPFHSLKKIFYFLGIIVLPALIVYIYWLLLKSLPMYEIRQCLPYSNADQPYNTMPWIAMWSFLKIEWNEASHNPSLLIFYVLTLLCSIQTSIIWFKNKINAQQKKILTLCVLVLGIYAVTGFHEYLKSGVWYRWFWAQPPLIVMAFIIFETAGRSLNKIIHLLLWSAIALMVGIAGINSWQTTVRYHNPSQEIAGSRGGIAVANPADWVATVNVTTQYLNTTLKPGELFFALPYDVIYYYLTGRPSPTRQTIFFEHINIPPEQEYKVIKEIEDKKVNYILLSNRFMSPEQGLGILGKTYCPVIGKYIDENFTPTARIGDWQHAPGWGWSHGTMILKRKINI